MRGWLGVGVVAVVVILAFAGEDEPASTGSPVPTPRVADPSVVAGTWTEIDCPVDAGDTDIAVTCGELAVPVRRDVAGGPTMGLAVAVLHRRADPGLDDAVLYLVGGPGGSGLAELEAWTTDPLLDERDIVLLDQRGTGWSTPSLQCAESDEAEDADGQIEAYERCRSRLVADGVDLEAYRTASIAADVADLRVALGYDTWNLWGSSYGTRVALAVLRDHPEGVRSAVLEGAYPMDVDAYADTVAAATSALEALFDLCDADPACRDAHPDLAGTFAATVDRLDAEPVTLDDEEGTELDGVGFVDAVVAGLGQSAMIPALPAWIGAIAEGGDVPLEEMASAPAVVALRGARVGYSHETLDDSEPLFFLVECAEELAHSALAGASDVADALGVDAGDPVEVAQAEVAAQTVDACGVWGSVAADPIEDAPVASDVPSLVLAGGLDPQTPPWWGEHLAGTLGRATLLSLPTLGHDTVDADWCPREVVKTFLDDPLAPVDTSCAEDMVVDFVVDGG